MGFWDWATTGREDIQGGLGKAASAMKFGGPVDQYVWNTAKGTGNLIQNPANPNATMQNLVQALYNANPLGGILSHIPLVGGFLGQGGSSGGSSSNNQTTPPPSGPTPPVVQSYDQMNPLAVSSFYSQAVAPLLANLSQQFTTQDQNFVNLAQNVPGQQYLTPDEKSMAGMITNNMALGNQLASQDAMKAAATAPVIDQIQNQMNTVAQRLQQAYAKALEQANVSSAGLLTGQGTTLAGTQGTAPTGTAPTDTASQAVQNALTSASTGQPATTSNVGQGYSIPGAGLPDNVKQALQSLGFTVT